MEEIKMWYFKSLEPGTPERNPRETEFFKLTTPAESLVREFIQNSLDAKSEECVSIRICLGSVSSANLRLYIESLAPHLEACGFPVPGSDTPAHYLTIEDYGTTGLDGSVEPGVAAGNFYNFWWREGISEKSGQKAGRWGLGKTTFHIVSKIRTFWGLTVRANDAGSEFLMGKALLKIHRIDHIRYQYFGYFCEDNYRPISDQDFILRFKNVFNISRPPGLPGLSIVIPFPDEEISFDSILKAVIQHYFYPVLAGTLRIEINDIGRREEINASNLIEKARSIRWGETEQENVNFMEILEFIRTAINQTPLCPLQIANPLQPDIVPDSFGNQLIALQQSFRSGSPIKFRVPIRIRWSDESEKDTFFIVLLKRFQGLREAFECYIRSGISITEIRSLGNRPVAAIFIADDEPLCEFLGDCENPAHTNWNERTEGFKEKYRNGVQLLRFIKKSLNRIVSILDEPPPGRQIDFLKEIFSIPVPPEEREEGEERQERPDINVTRREAPLLVVSQISGGFTVTINPQRTDIQFPFRAIVKIAYDTRRGNPFSQYEPFDFDVGSNAITITSTDCIILRKELNVLEMEVTGQNFRLEARGFDTKRDLVVYIREVQR
jgi:hypothetical protein